MHQNAVCIIGVALLALPFDVKVLHFACLLAHSQARNLNPLVLVVLEWGRGKGVRAYY